MSGFVWFLFPCMQARFIRCHYRNLALCRVCSGLPSVFFRALGKELLCRVLKKKRSAKNKRSAKTFFAECFFFTRGKEPSLPFFCRVFFLHSAKNPLCRVFFFILGKDPLCRVQKKETLGKEKFKSKFEALNKFKSKSFELQSCITSQDL